MSNKNNKVPTLKLILWILQGGKCFYCDKKVNFNFEGRYLNHKQLKVYNMGSLDHVVPNCINRPVYRAQKINIPKNTIKNKTKWFKPKVVSCIWCNEKKKDNIPSKEITEKALNLSIQAYKILKDPSILLKMMERCRRDTP